MDAALARNASLLHQLFVLGSAVVSISKQIMTKALSVLSFNAMICLMLTHV